MFPPSPLLGRLKVTRIPVTARHVSHAKKLLCHLYVLDNPCVLTTLAAPAAAAVAPIGGTNRLQRPAGPQHQEQPVQRHRELQGEHRRTAWWPQLAGRLLLL